MSTVEYFQGLSDDSALVAQLEARIGTSLRQPTSRFRPLISAPIHSITGNRPSIAELPPASRGRSTLEHQRRLRARQCLSGRSDPVDGYRRGAAGAARDGDAEVVGQWGDTDGAGKLCWVAQRIGEEGKTGAAEVVLPSSPRV